MNVSLFKGCNICYMDTQIIEKKNLVFVGISKG